MTPQTRPCPAARWNNNVEAKLYCPFEDCLNPRKARDWLMRHLKELHPIFGKERKMKKENEVMMGSLEDRTLAEDEKSTEENYSGCRLQFERSTRVRKNRKWERIRKMRQEKIRKKFQLDHGKRRRNCKRKSQRLRLRQKLSARCGCAQKRNARGT